MSDAPSLSTQPLADEWSQLHEPRELRYSPVRVGMLAFLLSEVAFFSTLITTYVVFLRETMSSDPSPAEVFHLPLVVAASICLFSSSATIHFAERALRRGNRAGFLVLWGLTVLLGLLFLAGTAKEWSDLIGHYGLTISRNMFGSAYFTLVGFHAAHVTVGLILLTTIWTLVRRRDLSHTHPEGIQVVSWYWHFVDGVWLVVFSLVYLVGR